MLQIYIKSEIAEGIEMSRDEISKTNRRGRGGGEGRAGSGVRGGGRGGSAQSREPFRSRSSGPVQQDQSGARRRSRSRSQGGLRIVSRARVAGSNRWKDRDIRQEMKNKLGHCGVQHRGRSMFRSRGTVQKEQEGVRGRSRSRAGSVSVKSSPSHRRYPYLRSLANRRRSPAHRRYSACSRSPVLWRRSWSSPSDMPSHYPYKSQGRDRRKGRQRQGGKSIDVSTLEEVKSNQKLCEYPLPGVCLSRFNS